MFTIRANYSDTIEVRTSLDAVREFFLDIKNFVELMPGVESIHTDLQGITHWKIRADVPKIGSFTEKFSVQLIENFEDRVEWLPALGETRNLLRYAADFLEKSSDLTLINFSNIIELRRNSAKEFHMLAGLAGESLISREMTKSVGEMIKIFISKAKHRLENQVTSNK